MQHPIGRRLVGALVAAATLLVPATAGAAITEDFDTVVPPGWTVQNNSDPVGSTSWFQGNAGVFPAHQGASNAYAGANFNSTAGAGTISSWLVSPRQEDLSSGDAWSFFTRKATPSPTDFPDRLELRLSTNGSCSPGSGASSVGDFTTLLTSVNPTLTTGVYPTSWTELQGVLGQMPVSSGCFALRYWVTNGGTNGSNSDYIGVDTFRTTEGQDSIAPDTSITAGPAQDAVVTTRSVTFTSAGDPAYDTDHLECRLDAAVEWTTCPATTELTGLADGEHTFRVRAVDAAGNADAEPATRTFSVDATAPETTIDSGPSGPVSSSTAAFTYSADDAGATFECRLDDGAFEECPADGTSYPDLPDGPHTFEVRATDGVDNTDQTPAQRTFTVDTVRPETTIDSGPTGTVAASTAAFTYSSDEPGSTFECRLDDAAFAACPADGTSYPDLDDGPHTFEVRATDAASNTDATPATRTFTVRPPAPSPSPSPGPSPGPTVTPAPGPACVPTRRWISRSLLARVTPAGLQLTGRKGARILRVELADRVVQRSARGVKQVVVPLGAVTPGRTKLLVVAKPKGKRRGIRTEVVTCLGA